MTTITVTQNQLADAFTELDRRYREEPERFMSEANRLLKETPHQYGQACAPYLIKIIQEQNTGRHDDLGPPYQAFSTGGP